MIAWEIVMRHSDMTKWLYMYADSGVAAQCRHFDYRFDEFAY